MAGNSVIWWELLSYVGSFHSTAGSWVLMARALVIWELGGTFGHTAGALFIW